MRKLEEAESLNAMLAWLPLTTPPLTVLTFTIEPDTTRSHQKVAEKISKSYQTNKKNLKFFFRPRLDALNCNKMRYHLY